MIGLILAIAAPMGAAPVVAESNIFTCEFLPTESSKPRTPPKEDLKLEQSPATAGGGGKWTVAWPGEQPMPAEAFVPSFFGCAGDSVGLRWRDENGTQRSGYICYSDYLTDDGPTIAWLSMDKPSLWQAPGYICATPPVAKTKGAK